MPTTGPAAQARYDDFFSLAYADGALDARTKILVALGASLAAGCSPWTAYCLTVGRQMGVTEEELDEALHVAMTVGATRMQVILNAERSAAQGPSAAAQGPSPAATDRDAAPAAFQAAEVVAQAGSTWTSWGPEDAREASPPITTEASGSAGASPAAVVPPAGTAPTPATSSSAPSTWTK